MEQVWRYRHEHMATVTSAFMDRYEVPDDQQKDIASQRYGYCELTS